MSEKPTVLILGGCGFIGRNLVHYLIKNDLASEIRVCDKTPPQIAYLNTEHTKSFENPILEFCSANLINTASCKNAFLPSKIQQRTWEIVINCAAESRPNQSDAVYKEGIYKLSLNCANEAAAHNVQRYIELSSGCINSSDGKPLKEDCKTDPWTILAKYKVKIEKELKSIENLNYTIFRLPLVYGLGDRRYLMPRIVIAAIYKYLNEPMKLLWNESLKLNTVHINDTVAAIWELARNQKAKGETYNIADDSNTTQGSLSSTLSEIFGIRIDYWGVAISTITKLNMSDAVSEINDKHMGPWAEICAIDKIQNTPLTPYMDEELLYHKHLNLDNSKLKSMGYELSVPKLTKESIEEILNDFIEQDLFPKLLMS